MEVSLEREIGINRHKLISRQTESYPNCQATTYLTDRQLRIKSEETVRRKTLSVKGVFPIVRRGNKAYCRKDRTF